MWLGGGTWKAVDVWAVRSGERRAAVSSVEQYLARGYSHAVAEQLAGQDEADLARRAVELNASVAPPSFPSNPALWFEGTKPAEVPERVAEGAGRFADLGRMAQEERDEEALIEQRVAAY